MIGARDEHGAVFVGLGTHYYRRLKTLTRQRPGGPILLGSATTAYKLTRRRPSALRCQEIYRKRDMGRTKTETATRIGLWVSTMSRTGLTDSKVPVGMSMRMRIR